MFCAAGRSRFSWLGGLVKGIPCEVVEIPGAETVGKHQGLTVIDNARRLGLGGFGHEVPEKDGERIVPRLGRLDFDGAEAPSRGGEQIDFEALPRPQKCEAGGLPGMEAPLPGIGHDEIFEKLSPQGIPCGLRCQTGRKTQVQFPICARFRFEMQATGKEKIVGGT